MQNFTSMSKLPYCQQSNLSDKSKIPCTYWDATQLAQFTSDGLLVPTHIASYLQLPSCKPDKENYYTCLGRLFHYVDNKGHDQVKKGAAIPVKNYFIADIERYLLAIDHSVRSRFGNRIYASGMKGYWLDCNDDAHERCKARPIVCEDPGHGCVKPDKDDADSLMSDIGFLKVISDFYKDRLSHKKSPSELPPWQPSLTQADGSGNALIREKALETELAQSIDFDEQHLVDDEDSDYESLDWEEVSSDEASALQIGLQEQSRQSASGSVSVQKPRQLAPARATNVDVSTEPVSTAKGDVFSIGVLMKAANISLDEQTVKNVSMREYVHGPSKVNGTYRSVGFVLVIRIHYTNVETWIGAKVLPWRYLGPPVHYTVRISKHDSFEDFLLRKVKDGGQLDPLDPEHSRIVTEYHGIRILIEQTGHLAVYDNIQFFLILTTTLALIAAANCVTDYVALNFRPRSDEYAKMKFERPRYVARQEDKLEHVSEEEEPSKDLEA
jgi:hypothetical protein